MEGCRGANCSAVVLSTWNLAAPDGGATPNIVVRRSAVKRILDDGIFQFEREVLKIFESRTNVDKL